MWWLFWCQFLFISKIQYEIGVSFRMSCPFLIVVHIFLIPISSGELDVILWDLSPDGSFSLRTASNIVHWIRPRDEAFFVIWQRHISSWISFFL